MQYHLWITLTPARLLKRKKKTKPEVPPATKAYTKPDSFTEEMNSFTEEMNTNTSKINNSFVLKCSVFLEARDAISPYTKEAIQH